MGSASVRNGRPSNPATITRRIGRGHRLSVAIAAATVLGVAATTSNAASATWTGTAADGAWANDANWNPAAAPGATAGTTTNTDTATFNTGGTAVTVDANRNVQNITFTNTTFTLNGGPLVLTSGGTLLAGSGAQSQTVNTPLSIQGDPGTYTVQADMPGTNRVLTLGGAISGAATGTNVTTFTLAGTSGAANPVNGAITDGAGGGRLALAKAGTGLWVLNQAANVNTYSGGTTVGGGTLRVTNSGNVSSALLGAGPVTVQTGGTLRFQATGAATFNNPLNVGTGGGFLSFRANSTLSPTSVAGTGGLGLSGDSGATLTLTTLGGFGGSVAVVAPAGGTFFLRLGTAFDNTSLRNAAIDLGPGVALTRQAGTNGLFVADIGALSGAATSSVGGSGAGAGTFVYSVGGRNENTTYAGTIANGGSQTGLTKVGAGSLTLSGANTYTGATTVNAGSLLVNGSLASSGTATVAVNNGGTLGGTGSIARAITVNAGGRLAPGTSPGVLTVGPAAPAADQGSLTMADGSTLQVELGGTTPGNAAANYDQVRVTNTAGAVTLAPEAVLDAVLVNGFAPAAADPFYILALEPGATLSGVFNGVPDNGTITFPGGGSAQISYDANWTGDPATSAFDGGGNDVAIRNVTGVPEPASAAVLGLGIVGLLARRRRGR